MEQQSHTVTTTEFAADAVELLSRTIRYSMKRDDGTTGTEHLVHTLLDDNEKPGAALVPGLNKSTSVAGRIMAMEDRHWVHDDGFHGEPVALDAPGEEDNRFEATAAWREALKLAELKYARKLPEGATWPEQPSGALREVLVGSVRLARTEGTYEVHGRHLARAVLNVGKCRAVEVMTLCRVDLAASASALDAQAEAVRGGAKPWPSETDTEDGSVRLLRQSGLLGERGKWWVRGLMSLMSRTSGDGSPVVSVLSSEARRQAARHGRKVAEQEDLLLAIPALDRALTLAGETPPEALRSNTTVVGLLRSHGMDHALLVRAADSDGRPAEPTEPAGPTESTARDESAESAESATQDHTGFTADAYRILSKARLLVAERGASTVGVEDVLTVLLDDTDGRAVRLLQDQGVDLAGVRAGLDGLIAT